MKITDVKVFPVDDDKLKAYATITFDNSFIVRDLKVISGNKGFFIAMPSKKRKDGTFRDVAHPLNSETRKMIEDAVLETYNEEAASYTTTAQVAETGEEEPVTELETEPDEMSSTDAADEEEPVTESETEPDEMSTADAADEEEPVTESETEPDETSTAAVADEEEPEKGAEENPVIEPPDDPDKAFGYEE